MDILNGFKKRYYKWLCKQIEVDDNYSILIDILWNKEFYGTIANDHNRCADGLNLRYFYSTEIVGDSLDVSDSLKDLGSCTCLEMLIALSGRMEDELYGSKWNRTKKELFWELLNNLGLTRYTDDVWYDDDYVVVNNILDRWLERRYLRSGNGSILPCESCIRDQRDVEIWYQMMSYLDINYPI